MIVPLLLPHGNMMDWELRGRDSERSVHLGSEFWEFCVKLLGISKNDRQNSDINIINLELRPIFSFIRSFTSKKEDFKSLLS